MSRHPPKHHGGAKTKSDLSGLVWVEVPGDGRLGGVPGQSDGGTHCPFGGALPEPR